MFKEKIESKNVSLEDWVEEAKADPKLYESRKIVEILLTGIGLSENLRETLYLKGGTLMAIAFKSGRATGDVDFSSTGNHEETFRLLPAELDEKMEKAATELGYLDIVTRVQTVKRRPRPKTFPEASFPALDLTIGYAKRDTKDEEHLIRKHSSNIIKVEISFKEQIYAFQTLNLNEPQISIRAYNITDLIAEKFRALFQQKTRNRNRRQDVYDIAFLIENHEFGKKEKEAIKNSLIKKAKSRELIISKASLDDPEIKERAGKEWETLQQEIKEPLPEFEIQFSKVKNFFENLPW